MKITTEPKYVIKFLKYIAELINFEPFDATTNPKLGEMWPGVKIVKFLKLDFTNEFCTPKSLHIVTVSFRFLTH